MSTRHLVDRELLPLLDLFPTVAFSNELLPKIRAREFQLPVDPQALAEVAMDVVDIPGYGGAPPVAARLFKPRSANGTLPCVLHIHGGGFVTGSAAMMEPVHRSIAMEQRCTVLAIDYRLAPETPFPGAVEDCYAALHWLVEQATTIGIDSSRIGVMGESAGGGLAAGLALLVRDRGEHALAFQHLIYPMLDDRTCATPAPNRYTGEFIWTPHNNAFGWSSMLGRVPGADGISPYAAPARAQTLSGLPPTYIATGALDLFLEEDLEYAKRLLREGVPVELHVYPGAFHGFDLAPNAQIADISRRDSRSALQRALHPTA